MEQKNLYIVVAVVLVAALVLAFAGLTGKNIKNVNEEIGQCVDTDNGDNPETPGTVSYSTGAVYKDECYAEANVGPVKYVRERYCVDRMQTQTYLCYGGCLENDNGEGYCAEGGVNPLKYQ